MYKIKFTDKVNFKVVDDDPRNKEFQTILEVNLYIIENEFTYWIILTPEGEVHSSYFLDNDDYISRAPINRFLGQPITIGKTLKIPTHLSAVKGSKKVRFITSQDTLFRNILSGKTKLDSKSYIYLNSVSIIYCTLTGVSVSGFSIIRDAKTKEYKLKQSSLVLSKASNPSLFL